MAVKMLTTKKHVKTAKSITKIKETNKPIEVAKADPKNMVDKPIGKSIKKIKEPKIMGIKQQANLVDMKEPKEPKQPNYIVTKVQYNRALKIVELYRKQNPTKIKIKKTLTKATENQINLYRETSPRVANRLCVYFREKGVELDMANFDVAYLKQINLSEISQMRNFGKGSLYLLKEYLEKQK
jgi:hypothetical protein